MTLDVCNLTKKYKSGVALDDVSFSLKKGVYGLIGENGAGKSTIMKILTRQISYDKGTILLEGEEWSDENKKNIGYLPQQFDFFEHLTVLEALVYLLQIRGIAITDKNKQILKWLEYLNLLECTGKRIKELSGGMRQRLGIAQAFMGNPDVILLDEPTVGLDPKERLAFRNMVNAMSDQKIVLISTHILDDVESTCEKMISLKSGKVTYEGSVANFIDRNKKSIYVIEIPKSRLKDIGDEISIISIKREKENLIVRFIVNDGSVCLSKPLYRNGSLKKAEKNLEDAYISHMGLSFRRQIYDS